MGKPGGRWGRATQQRRAEVASTESHCWLCGEPIDFGLSTPHPRSFEIDHVVPVSKGGDDTRGNLRAAHRECNLDRGAGPSGDAWPTSREW